MRLLRLGLCGILVLVLTGCGAPTAPVSGKVTYNGEPLPDGYISFASEGGSGPGGGGPIINGSYSLRAPLGKNRVQITASQLMPLPPGKVGMYGKREEVRQYLPARYNSQTELTVEIPNSGPLNFDLKSE